ncbi:hypothetical protein GGU10DRAFT_379826 [Lentinula aff. detonsa]|uniref:Uncharacterized protein n=1 Tax=Lentinula aff. detonsa TaxID=2804958 RepID=A0AA38KNU3_9AGAR|nr:hypothetical protein GGU10DRAFT_379826 [Lentinula aff. detonsa]
MPTPLYQFDNLEDNEQAALVVELDDQRLNPDLSNLRECVSIPSVTGSAGVAPLVEKINLAYVHAFAASSLHHTTYNSLLNCCAITGPSQDHSPTAVPQSNLDYLTQYIHPIQQSNFVNIESKTNGCQQTFATTKKRYKPVAKRVQPVPATLPEKFRVIRHIPTDPLEQMPMLLPISPPFTPTGRYTQERKEFIDDAHNGSFLWPEERAAVH